MVFKFVFIPCTSSSRSSQGIDSQSSLELCSQYLQRSSTSSSNVAYSSDGTRGSDSVGDSCVPMEIEKPISGGLEADELRIYANDYFFRQYNDFLSSLEQEIVKRSDDIRDTGDADVVKMTTSNDDADEMDKKNVTTTVSSDTVTNAHSNDTNISKVKTERSRIENERATLISNLETLRQVNNTNTSLINILPLTLPTKSNGFTTVSMYVNVAANIMNAGVNTLATEIVRACNNNSNNVDTNSNFTAATIYGDTFIGKAYDEEGKDWRRLSFYLPDLNLDSGWIASSKLGIPGSNDAGSPVDVNPTEVVAMNRKFHDVINISNNDADTIENASTKISNISSGVSEANDHKGNISHATVVIRRYSYSSWSQTPSEIEIVFRVDGAATRYDVKVGIHTNTLCINIPSNLLWKPVDGELEVNDNDKNLLLEDGATLWYSIDADNSTWTIDSKPIKDESGGNCKTIICTLSKRNLTMWPTLLHEDC